MAKFLKRLTLAVVSTHIAFSVGTHFYKKTRLIKAQTEEQKLMQWLIVEQGVPIVKDMAAKLKVLSDIAVKPGDVVIASYPKSGTTWVSEIIYNIQNSISSLPQDVDSTDHQVNLDERVPYMEWLYPSVQEINAIRIPRTLKSHLPVNLLPAQCLEKMKVVYVWRNPRDVAISYYHFTKMINAVGYNGNFPDFFQLFMNGEVAYGDWCSHVEGYWKESHRQNIFIISYEELTTNPTLIIKRLAEFLGKSISDEEALLITHRCSFNSMKKNRHTNYDWLNDLDFKNKDTPFLRKGKVGDWRSYFTDDLLVASTQMVYFGLKDKELRDSIVYLLPEDNAKS